MKLARQIESLRKTWGERNAELKARLEDTSERARLAEAAEATERAAAEAAVGEAARAKEQIEQLTSELQQVGG